ncbi:MAG: DMT family transporter [Muribaculaceae bacterium]|nr:DMT family transporter [Muribaculaceae bacterium]
MSELKTDSAAGRALRGNLLILTATIFFGVNIPVVKLLIPEWLTSEDVTVFRLGGGCLLFWLASLLVKTDRLQHRDMAAVLLGGGLGLFAFIFLFNMSLRYADPIDVSIIMTLPPVFVIVINAIFKHYRPGGGELAGMLLAFVGAAVVIIASHSGGKATNALLGNLLAIASAVCYALYLVVLEGPTHRYKPVSLLRWVFLASFVPCAFLLPEFGKAALFHAEHIASPALMVAFVVVCPTFLSYLLINPAIKLIGSELVSIYQYLVPVIATVASVIMHVAHLHTAQVLAMALILAGMYMTNRSHRKRAGTAVESGDKGGDPSGKPCR